MSPRPGHRAPDATDATDGADARLVGLWLAAFAVVILAIILVGGATRLTESGLSITEWRPVSGVVPPIGEQAWAAEFEKYQRIPQYRELNAGMTIDGFRRIYLWEYGHRLVARLAGLAFALPLAWFLARRRMPRRALRPTLLVLALLAMQAALGWWMVSSGLSVRTEVSQYRLAIHLAVALVILALTVWTAADLLDPRPARRPPGATIRVRALAALAALVLVTATSGALVAGLRAGRIFNTFPLMGGQVVPPGYARLTPWWRGAFENPIAAQFHHRVLAVATVLLALVLWAAFRRSADRGFARRMRLVLAAALLQLALGIATLLLAVPLWLGVAHQGGAALLLTAVLLALHAAAPAPAPSLRTVAAPAPAPRGVTGTVARPSHATPRS